MGYHKSLAGMGWISLVPTGVTYPDPIHLAQVSGMTVNVKGEDVDLTDNDGNVIDSFVSSQVESGTITLSDFSASILAAVSNGVTISANRPIGYTHQATVPSTPFQITVPLTTPTRTFTADLGVINLTGSQAMTADATATGTGVYAVATGTGQYTFNTADSTKTVLINYSATPSAADGFTAEIARAVTTAAPKFALHCYQTKAGKSWGLYVPSARISNLALALKKDGWSEVTLDWKAVADSNNKKLFWYGPE